MSSAPVLRLAIAAPLYRVFDYWAPPGVDTSALKPGMRLRVPFGRGRRCGLLLELGAGSGFPPERIKPALELLDTEPLLPAADLELLRWAAGYYRHPIGEVIFGALPGRLRQGAAPSAPGEPGWRLTAAGAAVDLGQLGRAPRQAQLLAELGTRPAGLSRSELGLRCGDCAGVLRSLRDKGWAEPVQLVSQPSMPPQPAAGPDLNPAQREALEQMLDDGDGFQPVLLDGVTGSGKTEVYLALAEASLTAGRQVLILVPEIGLTPQLLRRIRRRLGLPIALFHSGLSEGERERAWLDAASGRRRVLVGTRSAVFTPLPDLGLVIVDEEHDLSFKQTEGFRYSARDLAVIRAQRRGCRLVLGSATPSLESLRNAQAGRYRHLSLPQRAGGAAKPRVELLDLRRVRPSAGLSPALIEAIEQELNAGNQVLLFLNRRGYAPVLTCDGCGWISDCRRCDAHMTLHRSDQRLWCHHCGHNRPLPQACPECGDHRLQPLGQGTERVEEFLQSRFGDQGIARIDRDSTRRKGALERLLREIRDGRHRLLLGTQMLAKGHHFPDVTLVGILDIDQGLFSVDYRASERMAQLIVQVSGRAGRAEKPGRVLIQTRHPGHPLLQLLLTRGYPAFAEAALAERREARLPPFSHQALLRVEAQDAAAPPAFLQAALTAAQELAAPQLELLGPVPAPMEKRAGRTRYQLLLQAPTREPLQRLLATWVGRLAELPEARRVRWSLDVDPQEMY